MHKWDKIPPFPPMQKKRADDCLLCIITHIRWDFSPQANGLQQVPPYQRRGLGWIVCIRGIKSLPFRQMQKKSRRLSALHLAEREGFEPPEQLPVHRISSAARSTTPAPFLTNSGLFSACKYSNFFLSLSS